LCIGIFFLIWFFKLPYSKPFPHPHPKKTTTTTQKLKERKKEKEFLGTFQLKI